MGTRDYRLSQNFLRLPRTAMMLIGHSNIRKNDLVVEIGAGSGVITTMLAKRAREVWAIEPDPVAAGKLKTNLAKYKIENVKVIEKDFREVKMPETDYKVFSNPPFHLAAQVFYKLLGLENRNGEIIDCLQCNANVNNCMRRPKAIYLILQKQMALKLIPTDRHYTSKLGKMIIRDYDARIRYPLKPTDFTPPPKVPTVLYEAKLRFSDKIIKGVV